MFLLRSTFFVRTNFGCTGSCLNDGAEVLWVSFFTVFYKSSACQHRENPHKTSVQRQKIDGQTASHRFSLKKCPNTGSKAQSLPGVRRAAPHVMKSCFNHFTACGFIACTSQKLSLTPPLCLTCEQPWWVCTDPVPAFTFILKKRRSCIAEENCGKSSRKLKEKMLQWADLMICCSMKRSANWANWLLSWAFSISGSTHWRMDFRAVTCSHSKGGRKINCSVSSCIFITVFVSAFSCRSSLILYYQIWVRTKSRAEARVIKLNSLQSKRKFLVLSFNTQWFL